MSIRLEVGKHYLTRDGNIVGPMEENPSLAYPFCGGRRAGETSAGPWHPSYTYDGRYRRFNIRHELDIVAEWQEPVTPDPQPTDVKADLPDDDPKALAARGKPETHAVPPSALFHLGAAMADGEAKYGLFNWRSRRVSTTTYEDAMLRHIMAWRDGEDYAEDSGVHHLAHVMACCAIILDAGECETLNDKRGPRGPAAEVIHRMTKPAIDNAS